MSSNDDDRNLLMRYAETGCEQAFAELVARHIHHVYSVARRETSDTQLAEELTQAAFVILARKAKALPRDTVLSGWLFQTVRYAAKNARRSEARRLRQQQEIAQMASLPPDSDASNLWTQIAPLLNEIISALGSADRDAITLRFFEQKSHAEIAIAMNTSEASARKRLSRALERLRSLLAKRGVAVTSMTLAGILATECVQAAPGPLSATTIATAGTLASTSPLATTTLKIMAATKLKLSLGIGCLLLLGTTIGVVVLSDPSRSARESSKLPDGSTLRITDMVMTDQATFSYRTPLAWKDRLLQHLLPKAWSSKLISAGGSGSMSMRTSDGKDALFIAIAHENRPENSTINLSRLSVTSDDGSTFDGIFNSGTIGFMNEQLTAWHVHAFPRRGTNLQLHLFYTDSGGPFIEAATFNLTNPIRGPFPNWIPETLPIRRTTENLALQLVRFETAQGRPTLPSAEVDAERWKTFPTTHWALEARTLQPGGIPWLIRSLQIADATGNDWSPMHLRTWQDVSAEGSVLLHATTLGALWENEPAWKLRFELSRTNDFQPRELFSFTDLEIPGRGELREIETTRHIGSASARLRSIAGVGGELPGNYKWMMDKATMNLSLEVKGAAEDERLTLFQVLDDRGRGVSFIDPRGPYPQSEFVFSFSPQSDAKSLTFVYALHRSRFVEFRAKPMSAGAQANGSR